MLTAQRDEVTSKQLYYNRRMFNKLVQVHSTNELLLLALE